MSLSGALIHRQCYGNDRELTQFPLTVDCQAYHLPMLIAICLVRARDSPGAITYLSEACGFCVSATHIIHSSSYYIYWPVLSIGPAAP